MLIEEALVTHLLADSDIAGLISKRLYPLVLPQKPKYPAIVYQKISNKHIKSHQGSSGLARPRFQFDCWASTYAVVKTLNKALWLRLEGYRGKMGDGIGLDVYGAQSQNEIDDFEPDLDIFNIISDYFIWHIEEKPVGGDTMHGKFWIDTIVLGDGHTKIYPSEHKFMANSLTIRVHGQYNTRIQHYTESADRTSITFITAPKVGWPIEKRYVID